MKIRTYKMSKINQMINITILIIITRSVHSKDAVRLKKIDDQLLKKFDQGLIHTLAYHYLWPFTNLLQTAETDEGLELLQIQSDNKRYEINFNVKKFKPEELKVKVNYHYITVEGKHKEMYAQRPILTNHFKQQFDLPVGSKPEEVTAILNATRILTVSVPKHDVPPPLPERVVPVEVRLPDPSTTTEMSTDGDEDLEPAPQEEIEDIKERKKKELLSVKKRNEVAINGENDLDNVIDTQTEELMV